MRRLTRIFPFVFLFMLSGRNCSAEEASYTKDQLHQELEWAGRNCVRPKVPPPPPVRVVIPELVTDKTGQNSGKLEAKPWRRWIDFDGDGMCEIMDVMPAMKSSTGRFEGYSVRTLKLIDGNWTDKIYSTTLLLGGAGWFPLVLTDKKYKKTYALESPFYGLGGFKLNSMIGIDSYWDNLRFNDCSEFRAYIAFAYMLAFDPPPELKTDELMSDDFTGGDYIFAVFPGLRALTEKSESMTCIKPYLEVAADIDKRVRELYPLYFSGPHGLK